MNERHLVQDDPLVVNRELACAFGLNNSIIFRQLWFWLNQVEKRESQRHYHEGKYWIFNSYAEWTDKDNFPFWHRDTVRAGINELEVLGIVLSGNFNRRSGDNTKWYTISWPVYDLFMAYWRKHGSPTCGNGKKSNAYKAFLEEYYRVLDEWKRTPPLVKVSQTPYESFISALGNFHRPLPENTSENTQEKPSDAPAPGIDFESPTPKPCPRTNRDTHPLRKQYAEDGKRPNPYWSVAVAFWMNKSPDQVTHADIKGFLPQLSMKDGIFAKGSAFEALYEERGGFTPEQLQAALSKWAKDNRDTPVSKRPKKATLYGHIAPLIPAAAPQKTRVDWIPVRDATGHIRYQKVEIQE